MGARLSMFWWVFVDLSIQRMTLISMLIAFVLFFRLRITKVSSESSMWMLWSSIATKRQPGALTKLNQRLT